MTPAPIALLTDFGTADGYPGVMRGVVLGIAPGVPLVDLTHEIPPQDIVAGAWVLGTAWPYFPDRTIFLCVVDPGVGSERRAVAMRAGGRYFVGPDNGLFTYVMANTLVQAAVVLDRPALHLPHPSATFHGRDIFAPAAAHLAAGLTLEELGSAVASESLARLALPAPQVEGEQWVGHVIHVDRFGNLITDFAGVLADVLLAAPGPMFRIAGARIVERAPTFAAGPEGTPVIVRDSSGHLAVAVRNGSAASLLRASRGDLVRVEGYPHVPGLA